MECPRTLIFHKEYHGNLLLGKNIKWSCPPLEDSRLFIIKTMQAAVFGQKYSTGDCFFTTPVPMLN
jgi:hypothetical protein